MKSDKTKIIVNLFVPFVSNNVINKPFLFYVVIILIFNVLISGLNKLVHYVDIISNHQLLNFVKNVINVRDYGYV